MIALILAFIVWEEPQRRQHLSVRSAPSGDALTDNKGGEDQSVLVPVYKEAECLQELHDAGVATRDIERVKQRSPFFRQAYLRRYSAGRAHGLNPMAAHSLAESPSLSGCFVIVACGCSLSMVSAYLLC